MKIDAHQHFWDIARGDYGWLTPNKKTLYRNFGPHDLAPHIKANAIEGTVLVQAAPTIAETGFLLDIAERADFVVGVVGWADFEDPRAADLIAELADNPKLVGLRPMIQDNPSPDWMLREDLAPAFEAMIECSLTFDALTLPRHLPNLRKLVCRYPDLQTVIDHGSKPEIAAGRFDDWAEDMTKIAEVSKAYVKLSGLVNLAKQDWSVADLKPYVDHLLTVFGPDRLIWGSDWPVCTLVATYDDWHQAAEVLLSHLNSVEKAGVFGANAIQAYNILLRDREAPQ